MPVQKETAPELPKASKIEVAYFRNPVHSALNVIVQDEKDPEVIVANERFTPYYDTFKGDTVRVGYFTTSNKAIIERCRNDTTCEEITEKEYNQNVVGDEKNKPLRTAPTAVA